MRQALKRVFRFPREETKDEETPKPIVSTEDASSEDSELRLPLGAKRALGGPPNLR
jgi:hypothetical protein